MDFACLTCGAPVDQPTHGRRLVHPGRCARLRQYANNASWADRAGVPTPCGWCLSDFTPARRSQVTCSAPCRRARADHLHSNPAGRCDLARCTECGQIRGGSKSPASQRCRDCRTMSKYSARTRKGWNSTRDARIAAAKVMCSVCGRQARSGRTHAGCLPKPPPPAKPIHTLECTWCGKSYTTTAAGRRPLACSVECKRYRDRFNRGAVLIALRWCVACGGYVPGAPRPGSRCDRCRRKLKKRKVSRFTAHARDGRLGDRCHLCGESVDFDGDRNGAWAPTVDHVCPVSLGGADVRANVAVAHRWCNSTRGTQPAEDFRRMIDAA